MPKKDSAKLKLLFVPSVSKYAVNGDKTQNGITNKLQAHFLSWWKRKNLFPPLEFSVWRDVLTKISFELKFSNFLIPWKKKKKKKEQGRNSPWEPPPFL